MYRNRPSGSRSLPLPDSEDATDRRASLTLDTCVPFSIICRAAWTGLTADPQGINPARYWITGSPWSTIYFAINTVGTYTTKALRSE
ncbi:hypothetical protein RRG08_057899 [Elysia crispata]|uniref:Uncharacterized protein n=1 Tax=Elysia crispata TaxID=231223 RepID=A0AAE1DKI9_9GAST|nr:hypothetical protein RRG08_057899 [Elysia crispata]